VLFRKYLHCHISLPGNSKFGESALLHSVVAGFVSDQCFALELMMLCLAADIPSTLVEECTWHGLLYGCLTGI